MGAKGTGGIDALLGALPGIESAMGAMADASAQMAINEATNNFKENMGAAIASVINGAGGTIEKAAQKQ